jgi:hypothetical protein
LRHLEEEEWLMNVKWCRKLRWVYHIRTCLDGRRKSMNLKKVSRIIFGPGIFQTQVANLPTIFFFPRDLCFSVHLFSHTPSTAT